MTYDERILLATVEDMKQADHYARTLDRVCGPGERVVDGKVLYSAAWLDDEEEVD